MGTTTILHTAFLVARPRTKPHRHAVLRLTLPLMIAAAGLGALLSVIAQSPQAVHANSAPSAASQSSLPAMSEPMSRLAASTELHVCKSGCVYTSVQAAVNAANDGDAILVAQGTYTELFTISSLTQSVYLSKSIALRGGYTSTNWSASYPLSYPTTLDARGLGRTIYVTSNVAVTIDGFYLANGAVADASGGAIYLGGGNSLIQNNRIFSNTAIQVSPNTGRGGAIYVAAGDPTIRSNSIYSNAASGGSGGGVYLAGGNGSLQNNTIYSNTASAGGGVYAAGGNPVIEGNLIYANRGDGSSSDDGGGGIYVRQPGNPAIRHNAIYNNVINTGGSGAGIHIETTEVDGNNGIVIEQNAIYGNSGGYRGGGIYIRAKDHLIQNNLIYSNTTTQFGGGIAYWWQGNGSVEHNTIYANSAGANGGGGIYRNANAIAITGNIVASNTNYGVYGPITCDYCDVVGSGPANYGGGALVGAGTITQTPQFVNPGVSFKLQAGSPAIDAAEPGSGVLTDYDGYGRPFGSINDMGAYEYASGDCFARVGFGQIYASVQAAVNASTQSTDVVKVAGMCSQVFSTSAEGSPLTQTVYLSRGLTLRGGYAFTNWNAPISRTVLDAQNLGRAIYITGNAAITVDGFIIRNGSASIGGGIYVAGALSPTIQNVIAYNNQAGNGGGFATAGGNPRLFNNTFVSNTASITGGGLYLAAGSASIRNNIVASNLNGGIVAAVGATPIPAYNDVWNNTSGNYAGLSAGATDFSQNPLFVDSAAADFHLRYDSPAIHAADPNTSLSTDVEGDARPLPIGTAWYDVGADESTSYPAVTFTPKNPPSQNGRAGQITVYTYTLANTGSITDTYDLTHALVISGPATGWNVVYSTPLALASGESRQVLVNVQVGGAFSNTSARVYLTATSRLNSHVYDVVSNTTSINSQPAMMITPQYAENLNPGVVVTYLHTLQNAGDLTDTYTLVWSRQPNWPVIGIGLIPTQTQVFTLGPYLSTTFAITVAIQPKAPGGLTETVVITANSALSSTLKAIVTDTFAVNYVPGTRYAAPNGDDTLNNCRVAGQPCATIAHAVGQATFIDEVHVAEGTYFEYDIALNKNIRLIGGYNASYTLWDPRTYVSIIDAQQKGRVLYIFGSPTVKGLTLRNGKASGSGGGVYVSLGSPILSQNVIVSNEASVNGGGVYASLSIPAIRQNVITGNVAALQGGGIYFAGFSNPNFDRNLLAFNVAQQGAGYFNASGNPNFWNNLLYRNAASAGGGAYVAAGDPRLWHNTFYTNTANTGGALYLAGGSPMISNTIVAVNSALSAGGIYSQTGGAVLDFNDVWNNANGNYAGLSAGPNDRSVDPQFRNTAIYDLRLKQTSTLTNVLAASSVKDDHWGDPRPSPVNGLADIGADEFLLAIIKLTPNRSAGGVPGQTLTYTHILTNNGEYTDTILLNVLSNKGWTVNVFPPTLTLGVNLTRTISATVLIPANAISSTVDTTIVTATSGNDYSAWATVNDVTTVGRFISVSIEPDRVGLALSGQVKTYVHTLTNIGNYTDTFALQRKSSNNYIVTLPSTNVTLPGGASTPVTVSIQIPANLPTTTARLDITVITATSQLSPTIFDAVTDTTYINRTFGALLKPDRALSGLPGQTLTFLHTLTNTGNYTDTFDLTRVLTYTPATYMQNWGVTITPITATLGGGKAQTITATIDIPNRTVSNTSILSGTVATTIITATSQFTPAIAARAIDTITIRHVPGVVIQPGSICVDSLPVTQVVSFGHLVSNTGNAADSFTINAASQLGWAVTVLPTTTASVPADGATGAAIYLTVPPNPGVSLSTVFVTATSKLSNTVKSTVSDIAAFTNIADLTWAPVYSQAVVSDLGVSVIIYTHTLAYSSTQIPLNTISLNWYRDPHGPSATWPAPDIQPPGPFLMTHGQTTTVVVKVTVPFNPADYEPVNVTDYLGVSASASTGCESAGLLLQTDARRPRVALYPNHNDGAPPGSVITYVHTLSNTGGVVDTYDLTYTADISPAWNLVVTPTTVYTLPPRSGVPITVQLEVPAGTLSGTLHSLNITATSRFNPVVSASAGDRTLVPYQPAAILSPNNTGERGPGQVITYTHKLTNTGNYTETFSLTSQPEFGFPQVTPDTIGPLGPGQVYDGILVTVTLPVQSAGGETEETQIIAVFADGQQAVAVDSTLVDPITGARYVAPNGNDLHNNCAVPEYGACATIQQAIGQAQPGDPILVASGNYTGVLRIDKPLSLSGGYTTTNWLAPDLKHNPVMLDARGLGSAISITGNVSVDVSGLRLTGGNATNGGAIAVNAGQPVTLSAIVAYGNAANNGGALHVQSGDVRLRNSILYSNTASNGGAVYAAGTVVLLNDTLAGNQASSGGAVYLANGALLVTNTIVANNAAQVTGGAVYSTSIAAVAHMDYNNFWSNTPNDGNVPIGPNSIVADPVFADAVAGDFHLTAFSASLNKGLTVALNTDFESDVRPQFGPYDIGADEFAPIWSWQFTPAIGTPQHTTAPFAYYSHVLRNAGNYTDTANLLATIDAPNWSVTIWPTPTITLGPGLSATVLVTVATHPATPIGLAGTAIVTATSTQSPGTYGRAVDVTFFQNDIDLALSKSVTPTGWLGPGYPFTYTLVYTNYGPSGGEGVVITDLLPITMTGNVAYSFSGPAITAIGGEPFVWSVSSAGLVAGASGRITVTGIVSAAPGFTGLITNTARIGTTQNDITPTNDLALASSRIDSQGPNVLGQPLISPINNLVTSTRSLTFNWNGAAFSDPGGSGLAGYQLTLAGAGTYSTYFIFSPTTSIALSNLPYNVYTWTVRGRDNVGNYGTAAAPYTLTVDVPNLSVAKSAPPAAIAGVPFTYALSITNTGRMTATGAVLTDAIPLGAGFLSAGAGGVRVGNVVSWTNLTIAPNGGAAQTTFVVSACQAATNAYYRVATSAQGVGSPMGNPAITAIATPTTTAAFTQSKSIAPAGVTIYFTDTTTTNGNLVNWSWNFGDGQFGNGRFLSHAYSVSNTYTVTLNVRDACGVVKGAVQTIAITGTPAISIWPTGLGAGLAPGQIAVFTMTVSNPGTDRLNWSASESASWLSTSSSGGSIAPLTDIGLGLTFVAPATLGTYNTTLVFSSNDPIHPTVNMPITLLVTPRKIYLPSLLKNR